MSAPRKGFFRRHGYLARKLFRFAAVICLVSVLSFILVSVSPIDPVTAYLGADAMQISPEQRARVIQRWGLDRPPVERFAAWAKNILRGDLGHSVIFNQPVAEVIQKRFVASLCLMALAWTFSGLMGFVLGVLAGTFRGSPLDSAIRLYAYTLAATPAFWIGMLLLVGLGVGLGWFPVCCAGPLGLPPQEVTLVQRLHHLFLPALTLSVIGTAQIAMHTREKMIDVFLSDWALFASAQGETKTGIAWRHGLRHALLPAITLQFASLGELFGGSVLAEEVFSYPGLGQATVDAGLRGDVPLLLGIVIFSALFVVAGNLLADLLYGRVDPRIQPEGGRP